MSAELMGDTEEGAPEPVVGGELPVSGSFASAEYVAMHAARGDAVLAAKAGAYFESQSRLVEMQTEHLHEQRRLVVSCMRLKRRSEWLRIVAQFFITVSVVIVSGYLVLMLRDAAETRAVIVEPFDTPPAMAADGRSGKVVAGALLDQLIRMQLATQSSQAKRELADSWSNDIKVEVPTTGISIGEIDRLLRRRLGHEIHIGGDLVQGPQGRLELTVRAVGIMPRTFEGAAGDLHALTTQAGEYVYGQTQPALFALYLNGAGRSAETLAFVKGAMLTARADDRPYLLNAWAEALANTGAPPGQVLALELQALALKPDYWTVYANAISDTRNLPDEEGAWRLGEAMRRAAGGRPGAASELSYAVWDLMTGNMLAARDALVADAEAHAGVGTVTGTAAPAIAGWTLLLHDAASTRAQLALFDMKDRSTVAAAHFITGKLAALAGDAPGALRELELWAQANADPAISQGDNSYHCELGQAEAAAGAAVRADASFAAGGKFVDCIRFRADALDHRGDWAGAQRGYAEAVALAPDLPAAYLSWGLALARHGDAAGAMDKVAAAHRLGPHWADPLKAWGDLLAQGGRWREAREKYDAALRYAPAWPELRAARDGRG